LDVGSAVETLVHVDSVLMWCEDGEVVRFGDGDVVWPGDSDVEWCGDEAVY
jgi:hypothetical protein